MREKKNVITKWIYWFLFAVAVIVVYKTLDNFKEIGIWFSNLIKVLSPFIVGIFLSYLFYIPCRKIETLYKKRKIKIVKKKARVLSVITVYLIALLLLIIAINVIIPAIANSFIDLANNFQNYYIQTIKRLSELPDDSIFKSKEVVEIIKSIQEIDIKQYVNLSKITEYAQGAINLASGIFDIFVAIIVSIYILLERAEIIKFLKKLVKNLTKPHIYRMIATYFNKTNSIFFKFLSSQLLDAVVVGILASVAMSILGVKYAVLLGFLIGLSNMIPYFGAIIGVGISIIITLFTGGISQAVWMAIIVIILQQIDANIINPKIVGNSLKISPLLVIFAVTIGGAYFGLLGMFLAVPIITVIKLLICDLIEMKNVSEY